MINSCIITITLRQLPVKTLIPTGLWLRHLDLKAYEHDKVLLLLLTLLICASMANYRYPHLYLVHLIHFNRVIYNPVVSVYIYTAIKLNSHALEKEPHLIYSRLIIKMNIVNCLGHEMTQMRKLFTISS